MVTCVDIPGVVQVSFLAQRLDQTVHEIFCYVRAKENGMLEILYSYSVTRSRETDKGTWTEMSYRFPLNDQLRGVISYGVMSELFRVLASIPEEAPGNPGASPSQVLAPALVPNLLFREK